MAGRLTSTRHRIRSAVRASQNGSLPIDWLERPRYRYSRDAIVIAVLHKGIEPKRLTHYWFKVSEFGFELAQGRRGGEVPHGFIGDGQLGQVRQVLAFGRRACVSPNLALGYPEVAGELLFNGKPHLVDKKKMRHPTW